MTRGIVFADVHADSRYKLHPSYLLVKKFAKIFKPNWVVDLGDSLDLQYFSSFDKDKPLKLLGASWKNDVALWNEELDFWTRLTKDYTWMEGNHDYRAVCAAEQDGIMADSIDYVEAFRIRERGIKWITMLEQTAHRGKLFFTHGWYTNKYHTSKHLDEFAGNLMYGHKHAFQTHSRVLAARKEQVQAWSIGCLCDQNPFYLKGKPSQFQNGFAVVYMDRKGNFNVYPINIIHGRFIFEGKEYKL